MQTKIINGEEVRFDPGVTMGAEFLEHRDRYDEFLRGKAIVSHAHGLTEIPALHRAKVLNDDALCAELAACRALGKQ